MIATAPGTRSTEHARTVPSMGGWLQLRVATGIARPPDLVERDLRRVTGRVERWAARLTRFEASSELSTLNGTPDRAEAPVGPTLAAVLAWAERAADLLPDLVDITLLDARLAAETGPMTDRSLRPDTAEHEAAAGPPPPPRTSAWYLRRTTRGGTVIRRRPVRFDLDGVAKGWIADRALALLRGYPSALVDADGDAAVRVAPGTCWRIGIADPRPGAPDLGCIEIDGDRQHGPLGIATSGTTVHRWVHQDGVVRHHLIDPRTRRPAATDVLQATVIATSARVAEVFAKSAVIAGSGHALALLDRADVHGAVLVLETGEVLATPRTVEWLV